MLAAKTFEYDPLSPSPRGSARDWNRWLKIRRRPSYLDARFVNTIRWLVTDGGGELVQIRIEMETNANGIAWLT
jgi:hypothetical protein